MPFKTSRVGDALLAEYQQDPRYLMAMQGMQQGGSTAPIYSPMEGIARALQAPLAAYSAKKLRGEYEGKQADQYGAIADILAPQPMAMGKETPGSAIMADGSSLNYSTPNIVEGDDPAVRDRRENIMKALQSGLITPSAIGPSVVEALGFGKAAEPIKVGKNDRLYAPGQYDKPLVDAAPEPKDYNKPFFDDGTPNPAYQAYTNRNAKAGASQTNLTVNTNKSFGQELGGNAAKILDASKAAADGAVQTIGTVNQIRSAIDTGQVTAGPGATAVQFFNQIAGGDPNKLAATRNTIQGLAKLTLAARKSLQGQGQITDREQALLEKATSGSIDSMTLPEIRVITDVAERAARADIKRNRANVDKARRVPGGEDVVDFYNVDEPAPYKPAPKKSGRFTIEAQ